MPHHAVSKYQPPADVPSMGVFMPALTVITVVLILVLGGRR
ncbi:hypothetical protein ACLIYM_19130 [Streptomyces fenghuangensis]|uniref:Uncharacterized protein n=1 Tax=Streptomyces chitinivorans TaxID=1257027 RepID=A0ABW7HW25_9ACTN|nr:MULTISPECIES: hypothetical protein [Streptomyces]MDH2411224.1 hypothetical protein [Streptomyces chitinivorans]